jgi:hypothetical protein
LCGPKQRCFVDKKANGTFIARCDNPPKKKKPDNMKDKKGNKHAKSAFIVAVSQDSNTKEIELIYYHLTD